MATAILLTLQETVARWEIYDDLWWECVWGFCEAAVKQLFFSEPLMETGEQEVAKILRLQDMGFTAILIMQGKHG